MNLYHQRVLDKSDFGLGTVRQPYLPDVETICCKYTGYLLLLKTYTKRAFFVSVYVLVFGVIPVWDWVYQCVRNILKFSYLYVFYFLVYGRLLGGYFLGDG